MSKKELVIWRAEKDVANSVVVIETSAGQDWISCAECRIGEMECDYLKWKWRMDPCLYRRGVRLGRNLEPDPRDVVRIVEQNLAVCGNMVSDEGLLLKSEMIIMDKVLQIEGTLLERAKEMLFLHGHPGTQNGEGLKGKDLNNEG